MVHEFLARYSEDVGREAVRRFLGRRMREWLGLKLCLAALALTAYLGWLIYTGNRSWWVGLLAATLILIPSIVLASYAVHWHNTVGRIRRMQVPMARFTVDETQIAVASELGSATFPWSLIVEVWEFPELWLLLLSKNYFVTLPTDGVPASALEFIRAKVRSTHPDPVRDAAT
jgi:hypothetical protein